MIAITLEYYIGQQVKADGELGEITDLRDMKERYPIRVKLSGGEYAFAPDEITTEI